MADVLNMATEQQVNEMHFYINMALLMVDVAETYTIKVQDELTALSKGAKHGELKGFKSVINTAKALRQQAHKLVSPAYTAQHQAVANNFAECSDFLADANVELFKRMFSAPHVELALLNAIRKFPTSVNVQVVSDDAEPHQYTLDELI